MPGRPLVLASGSPRRREILAQMGLRFEVVPSQAEEPAFVSGSPERYALGLAAAKADAVAPGHPGAVVLGADTIVVIDGQVLGKPEHDGDGRRMIDLLKGRTHEVITAVALRGEHEEAFAVRTLVTFRPLLDEEVEGYVACGEGRDKAGAYGIQAIGAGLVRRVDGSYSNVVGLPAAETIEALRRAGVLERWP